MAPKVKSQTKAVNGSTPKMDEKGNYIGKMVNWEDVSEQRKKVNEAVRLHSSVEFIL